MREKKEKGEEVKDGELVLFGHSNMIINFTATKFDEEGRPQDGERLQNAEIIEYEFEY